MSERPTLNLLETYGCLPPYISILMSVSNLSCTGGGIAELYVYCRTKTTDRQEMSEQQFLANMDPKP